MGLGLQGGGIGAAQWFSRAGAHVLVTDLRNAAVLQPALNALKKYKNISYVLGRHRIADFKNQDLIIKNPGVRTQSKFLRIARQQHIPIESDIGIFLQSTHAPIIAITGTKGKSTTASLLQHIFRLGHIRANLAGNIRVSPLFLINKVSSSSPVILELSSWQLEDIAKLRFQPHVAIVTNIMQDHLNTYSSCKNYVRAKENCVRFQRQNDHCILNLQNINTKRFAKKTHARVWWYSATYDDQANATIVHGAIAVRNKKRFQNVIQTSKLQIRGDHNLGNILAAVIAARIYGVPIGTIRDALKTFRGIQGRLEYIGEIDRKKYYNDTTATAPDAAIAALKIFDSHTVLIAGGADKNLDYSSFADAIRRSVTHCILLPGTATEKIKKHFRKAKFRNYTNARSMEAAVIMAGEIPSARTVLLSPGAASFGLFLNEFDRGDRFTNAVLALRK